jgi:hypothetical protein
VPGRRSWVWLAGLGSLPLVAAEAAAAEPQPPPPALSESTLDAWLDEKPGEIDPASPDPELVAASLPPRRHGLVIEGSAGALGHLGNMRDVSPVAPYFRFQLGYELYDWLMLLGQADLALSSTSLANRPPEKRGYALFGMGAGGRLSWQAFTSVGFYLQGDAGFASVDQDVLATYGYPDADRLRPYAGGSLGVEWFQLSPHYALALSGGGRSYFQSFDRINGDRAPLVWFSSVAIRYAL